MSTKENAIPTFYRTVIMVEVLSEEPFAFNNLEDLHHAITSGDCSGRWTVTQTEQVDGRRMVQLLLAHGSDPGFFRLTDGGEDVDSSVEAEWRLKRRYELPDGWIRAVYNWLKDHGLGRRFAWADFLDRADDLPLFRGCDC